MSGCFGDRRIHNRVRDMRPIAQGMIESPLAHHEVASYQSFDGITAVRGNRQIGPHQARPPGHIELLPDTWKRKTVVHEKPSPRSASVRGSLIAAVALK